MVKKNVLPAILRIITLLNTGKEKMVVLSMLKTIRSLTNTTIEELINSKAVSSVCPFLSSPEADIQTQVLNIIFHMVRLKRECREEAALNGIIPKLQELATASHIPRDFVVGILCKMADASSKTLYELKKHNGIEFFLNMIEATTKAYLQVDALRALQNWLRAESCRVEVTLIQPHHCTKLINVFRNPKNKKDFLTILNCIHEMTKASKRLAYSLGSSEMFLHAIEQWLNEKDLRHGAEQHNTHILIILLKFIENIFDQLVNDTSKPSGSKHFAQILFKVIKNLREEHDGHLVKIKSEQLLERFKKIIDITKLMEHE